MTLINQIQQGKQIVLLEAQLISLFTNCVAAKGA